MKELESKFFEFIMEDDEFDVTNVPNFASPKEEAEFWKSKALKIKKE